jgi:uncharacterized protein
MTEPQLAARLHRLPVVVSLGREVPVAVGLRARLLGLSRLHRAAAGAGLLIPRCASVHTLGMRFALDLYFLDRDGAVLRTVNRTPANRVIVCRGASAVLEVPAGEGGEFPAPVP